MNRLVDGWGRQIEYVRLSLTEACNFCCPYCRPAEITPHSQTNLLNVDQWMVLLEAFHLLGVKAVRLTGGEPLLYPHLDELLQRIHNTQWFTDVSMTTNGSLLAPRIDDLVVHGLQRVNISLDAVTDDDFRIMTGEKGVLHDVLQGIEAALASPLRSVKINTVLTQTMADDDVIRLLDYLKRWQVVWRFIEYMPFQGHAFKGPSFDEFQAQLERVSGATLTPLDNVLGFGPATYYRLGDWGTVGFIFPMSHSYCAECNRVRLTSDGHLRLCLLRDDEADMVGMVKTGHTPVEIALHIQEALQRRKEEHGGYDMEQPERSMYRIGG